MENRELIIAKFKEIKAQEFIESTRKHNTGIGKTFEDYIGVEENNHDEADFAGYEIKAHREESQSYVTLFTKSPTIPKRGANAYLKDNYGVPYEDNPNMKCLHTSMFTSRCNTYKNLYSFKLLNDRDKQMLKICIYDVKERKLLDDSVGYNYADIDKILHKKLKSLFYVNAERKYEKEEERNHISPSPVQGNGIGTNLYQTKQPADYLSTL